MRILDIALKDLRQVARERQSAFFLLIMPVLFTILFGFAFGGFGGGQDDPRLPVGLLDEDGGVTAAHLTTLLADSDVIRLVTDVETAADLESQVTDGNLAAAVIIPAGYDADLLAGTPAQLTVYVDAGNTAGITVQGEISGKANRLMSAVRTATISTETAVAHNQLPDETARQRYFEESLGTAVAAWADPPVQVQSSQTGSDANDGDSENAFAHSSPGMMAQFAIAGLMTVAQILVLERKNGSLRRLLTTSISRFHILLGHYLAMFTLIFAQLLILVLFGQIFLRLPYFDEPAATMLLILATTFFAASLGLLISVVSKTEEQAIVFSLAPMFVLAALGGAWVPLEFTPEAFQRIAYLTPIAWTVDGFKDVIVRGLGLESVLVGTAVLLGYALVLFGLSVWRFRFE
ncbi:MAG: ABC transporter permease [Anaerolineae bacterium]